MIDQYKSLSEKFLKKGFWLYLFSFIIAPIGYIVKIIISGDISVSELGILYGIISLITLVSAYNDLGMSESINYFIPKFVTEKRYDKVKTILVFAFIAQMITGISIALFFFFGADFIATNYFKSLEAIEILKVFAFYFLGINIFQILSIFFMATQNTFANKISEFIRMLFILISVFSLYFLNIGSLENYSYAWIVGLYIGIIFIVNLFYFRYYKKYLIDKKILWDKYLFYKIFRYAIIVFIGAQASTILGQIDMQMIIYLLGTTDAGYYTNYLSIVSIPFMIIIPIFALLFPVFSELHSKGEIEKIKTTKEIFIKVFLAVGLMFNIFFFVFAEKIAFILFGEKYLTSGIILKYSVLFLIFNFLLQINFNIMAGIGKLKERVKILGLAIIFNTILNMAFIKLFGVAGAALATAFGWILIFVLSEISLGKKYRVNFDFKIIFKNIIFLGVGGILFYYFGIGFFENLSRFQSFGLLFLFSIIWFLFFVGINYNMFKNFILEVKRLRK
ncbi:hypothetical protein CSB07_01155 [Candidatus Gracilibacteria bacterium]|nr:MAG: hypothetical protein CSB07_01155 [Candidatus Gracilibacteria bacterium]PIE85604.1 MAG: hypothetical protein CSA08_01190 [Candidatus Gracilibacteria bacterium]